MVWRDLRSFEALNGNNFFWFIVLILYQQPSSGVLFVIILAVLFAAPLASDPLRRIPRERLDLWPLSRMQRVALRIGSVALSPVAWIAFAILLWTAQLALAAAIIGVGIVLQILFALAQGVVRDPQWSWLRWTPRGPGRFGELTRKDIRQMLCTLDVYVAAALAASTAAYRFLGHAPAPEAFPIMAVVVGIGLSTVAQCLFGLDGASGRTRYRLLPVHGHAILLSKGAMFIALMLVFTAPLNIGVGAAAALAALAIGHHHSVLYAGDQQRWRLTSGVVFLDGCAQAVAMAAITGAIQKFGPVWIALAAACYAVSLFWYGREWDRMQE